MSTFLSRAARGLRRRISHEPQAGGEVKPSTDDDIEFFRGLLFAIPLSTLLWIGIIFVVKRFL